MTLEWSHGKRRATARTAAGDVPALPPVAEDPSPTTDPKTGRFLPGNRMHRRRQVKERARGIATLNPKACPSWLSPFVADGVRLAGEFAQRFPDDPALRPLLGAAVDSWVVYRALLALGAQGDGQALSEARAWLREHRAAIATLAALAGEVKQAREASVNPHAALAAAITAKGDDE